MSAGGATGEPLGYVTLPDWPEIAVSREREWNCDRDGYITVSPTVVYLSYSWQTTRGGHYEH